jgi:hypothetical protein
MFVPWYLSNKVKYLRPQFGFHEEVKFLDGISGCQFLKEDIVV